MIELLCVSCALLCVKLLTDLSKFRWDRTWLSDIRILNIWRNLRSPFDLWHILYGSVYTYIAFDRIYSMGYGYDDYRLYLYTAIWWAIFFTSFSLLYHYGTMKREWWGS
jgi:hypothetical protein